MTISFICLIFYAIPALCLVRFPREFSRLISFFFSFYLPGSQEGGPSFYQHPEGIKTSRGSAVKFTCSARGLPRPIITWMKDGKAMRDLNAESSQSNDTSTLSIWNVQERHRGSYWCVASSSGLNATSNKATLSLKGKVSFVTSFLRAGKGDGQPPLHVFPTY